MKYEMYLTDLALAYQIPVLPNSIKVSDSSKNQKFNTINLGEIVKPEMPSLRVVEWSSFFPKREASYTISNPKAPKDYVEFITSRRINKSVMRFIIVSEELDLNDSYVIDTFTYEEKGGEVGDIYYTIRLTQFKEFKPSKLKIKEDKQADKTSVVKTEERQGAPPDQPKTYTVVRGDCLWNIAKKFYGKGEEWKKIYEANKRVIGKNPNLIYAGQVYTIP